METARCRDLGRMDYKVCWELQQQLFDEQLARKSGGEAHGAEDSSPVPGIETEQTASSSPVPGIETEQTASSSPLPSTAAAEAVGAIGNQDAGTILLVEHPPVYTLGKSGHAANLLIAQEALQQMGAQFFHIDRGGDITFHGPGQLVCYPILDLERIGISLRDYIDALEEAVIRTVATFGIAAGRITGASGVWVSGASGGNSLPGVGSVSGSGNSGVPGGGSPRKICAIGVRSSRYVTMHGFALNVSTDLEWFARINPCGFTDRGVTSMAQETGHAVSMDEVKELVVKFLGEKLNVRIYK